MAIEVAADRADQPAQPIHVEAVLAAQLHQHLGGGGGALAVVVGQLHVADGGAVPVVPLDRPEVHARDPSTSPGRMQAGVCPHLQRAPAAGTPLTSSNRPRQAPTCPSTAELRNLQTMKSTIRRKG